MAIERARVAVLLSGTGSNMAALLYASRAADCPYEIVLVTGDKPDAPGLTLAEAEGVSVVRLPAPTKATKAAFFDTLADTIEASGAEVIALAGFMRFLPPTFVARFDGRILNIHPSLLPAYKGLDTHARALAAGDTHGGCSVHIVTAELDDGPLLDQTRVAVLPADTPATLGSRVLIAEHQLYPRCLAAYVARERDPEWVTERVGTLALALPETEYRLSHGTAAWRIAGASGKFFAYVTRSHHGEAPIALLVRTSGPDEMAALIDAEPDLYYRPAYYGASGWIALRLDRAIDWAHVEAWLQRSWRSVAPRRLAMLPI